MNATDLVTAAVLFGPGLAGTAAYLTTQRGWRTDSAAVRTVLAESAAAARAAVDNGTPPRGGEPAPEAAPAEPVRLATVLPFPTTDRRAA
ncbi:hypothetical protein AB0442_02075 [Kitasatospora sp. NPDC085895]|uniref:hypothetical protein n=1 Tax=Kitasatospora sp. NPDC085895 TaxID=3155057 RepID=UPI00344CE9D0